MYFEGCTTYVLKEPDSEPKTGNGQLSVRWYYQDLEPPRYLNGHFGWNIARESSPAPFLSSGSSHISFPLCQLKSDPPANPSDSVTIIHYVQNLCFSTSWRHLKTSLPSLSTWNRQKAQIKPKAQQCANKNQITFISCFDMVSSKIRPSHLNAKRLRSFFAWISCVNRHRVEKADNNRFSLSTTCFWEPNSNHSV